MASLRKCRQTDAQCLSLTPTPGRDHRGPGSHTNGSGGMNFVEVHEAKTLIAPAREPIGERVNDVPAVAFKDAMIAVVQEDDVSSARAPQAANHGRGRLRFPVPGEDRPHHDAQRAERATLAN